MTGLNRILNDKSERYLLKSLPITLADLTLIEINHTENTSNVSHFFPENITATNDLK